MQRDDQAHKEMGRSSHSQTYKQMSWHTYGERAGKSSWPDTQTDQVAHLRKDVQKDEQALSWTASQTDELVDSRLEAQRHKPGDKNSNVEFLIRET